MSEPTTRGVARSWIARHRVALVAGVTAFLVAIGGGAGWAYLTASATATGSISTQAVSVAQTGFSGMGAKYLPSDLTETGSFTVTNTGSVGGTAAVTIAAPESWASGLPIRVWPTTAAACSATSPPDSALSGTWAAPPAISTTLAAGASIVYCVRTIIPDWKALTSTGGSQQANPAIAVSLSADGWVASATGSTHVQQTAGMYPLTTGFFDSSLSRWFTVRANANTGFCLDVSGSGGTGAAAIAWGCHSNSNQRWEFVPVSGSDQSLVTIKPRHAPGIRVTYSGTSAIMQTAASTTAQQWYVQQIDATRYQLVSAATGLCLGLATTAGTQATMVDCDATSAQLRFEREPLTFGAVLTSVTLTFGGSSMPAGTLQRCTNTACSTYTAAATISSSSSSVTFTANSSTMPNNTTSTYRIVDSSSNVLWDGIQLRRSGTTTITAVAGIG
ncbi:RICIN domain-containing protein [Microbacterium sp.]|uniref:RICIN domain-containing protein n=1 Tax=Microbacterium sp. TaxID=51671 RepID=UPI0039E67FEB